MGEEKKGPEFWTIFFAVVAAILCSHGVVYVLTQSDRRYHEYEGKVERGRGRVLGIEGGGRRPEWDNLGGPRPTWP